MNLNPSRGFVPERVAMTANANGLTPGLARTLVTEYATCPGCESSLQGAVSGGHLVDRDIEFDVECPDCSSELSVLVEEKVWGFASSLDEPYVVGDVFDYNDSYFFVNPSCIYVSVAN